jgi:hypothetical protein
MQDDFRFVTHLEEGLRGAALIALTLAIHGVGVLVAVHSASSLRHRFDRLRLEYTVVDLAIVILATWIIVAANVVEVTVWAAFLLRQGAQSAPAVAFYNALLNFTTLQAGYLPTRWRLLEGMLGIAGFLTFASSTGVLVSMAQQFQELALVRLRRRVKGHAHRSRPVRSA